ncbi:hypothetical protein ACFFX0_09580 [Citricoccus parietis]|uniref:Uncharacterized protein n=1 Tax=Citricoccus parietis TaxID=592307 RepID=A0ABV5FXN4_9MICC
MVAVPAGYTRLCRKPHRLRPAPAGRGAVHHAGPGRGGQCSDPQHGPSAPGSRRGAGFVQDAEQAAAGGGGDLGRRDPGGGRGRPRRPDEPGPTAHPFHRPAARPGRRRRTRAAALRGGRRHAHPGRGSSRDSGSPGS